MSTATMLAFSKRFRWQHVASGVTSVCVFNAAALLGLGKTYRWIYEDEEKAARAFMDKYGQPSEAQRLELFAYVARNVDKTSDVPDATPAPRLRKDHFAHARGDVLEVAVGTGEGVEALLPEAVSSYVGVDCVEAMVEAARGRLGALPAALAPSVELGDAHRLPFPDRSFDTVVASQCLCSVEHPEVALREMARVCRPDGEILLVEPGVARSWPVRAGQRYLGLRPKLKHAWEAGWFDDRDVPALMEACDALEVTDMRTRALGNWYLVRARPRS